MLPSSRDHGASEHRTAEPPNPWYCSRTPMRHSRWDACFRAWIAILLNLGVVRSRAPSCFALGFSVGPPGELVSATSCASGPRWTRVRQRVRGE
eukprot:10084027-Alexandrium_andersonii.AAC.1